MNTFVKNLNKKISQNTLALKRHGNLFKNLTLDQQAEILFDIESDMLEGNRETVVTDRDLAYHLHPKARSGEESYGEGEQGKRSKGITRRKSPPHDHTDEGGHIPLEGKG